MSIEKAERTLTRSLQNEHATAHSVVTIEDKRVQELLNEEYFDKHQYEPKWKLSARKALAKFGINTFVQPQLIERQWLEGTQTSYNKLVDNDITRIKKFLDKGVHHTIKGEIDKYLGIGKEKETILPTFLKNLYENSTREHAEETSFIDWLTDFATKEQFINVLQWNNYYLKEKDSDPEFQERITGLKAEYVQNIQSLVDSGRLHPSLLPDAADIDNLIIKHASPLSPVTAQALGFAEEPEIPEIYIRDEISDFTIFHEITHKIAGGFNPLVNEGVTDAIAAMIFEQSRKDKAPIVYNDQIAMYQSLERMTEGRINFYKLSELYAGEDQQENTIRLSLSIDSDLNLPLFITLYSKGSSIFEKYTKDYRTGSLREVSHIIMKDFAEFMEAMLIDENGKQRNEDLSSLAQRIFSKDTINRFGSSRVLDTLELFQHALEEQKKLAEIKEER